MTTATTSHASSDQTPPTGVGSQGPTSRIRQLIDGTGRFSALGILVLIIVLFGVLVPDTFLQSSTFQTILADQAITAILAVGVVISVSAGAFDLSIAATMGLASVVVMWGQNQGHDAVLSSIVAIGVATLVGVVNGFLVVKVGLDSLIATLGMSSILAAAAYWVTDGALIVEGISKGFIAFGTDTLFGLPYPVYYMVVFAGVAWFWLDYRPGGRELYAVGGSRVAARLAGVRVDRVMFWAFVVSAAIAGFAGVVLAAKLGTGNPGSGPPYLLPVFTAVFLGATQIKRTGRPNIPGTLLAIFLLATGVKGLQLIGAPAYINDLFNGVALIIALSLAMRKLRKA